MHTQTPAILSIISEFAAVMRELVSVLFRSAPSNAQRAKLEAEHQQQYDADAEIRRRYGSAFLNHNELERRAKAHRVDISRCAEDCHKAAILDYLDNPTIQTPLTSMHMTWFNGVNADGSLSHSMTHPVNRAKYHVEARDLPELYPAERLSWGAAQWGQHEKRQAAEFESERAASFRADAQSWVEFQTKHRCGDTVQNRATWASQRREELEQTAHIHGAESFAAQRRDALEQTKFMRLVRTFKKANHDPA